IELEKKENEIQKYKNNFLSQIKIQILNLDTSEKNKSIIFNLYEEMIGCDINNNNKYHDYKEKIIWSLKLPHNKTFHSPPKNIPKYFEDIQNVLDKNIYGMKDVKERIIHGYNKQTIMCLKGKPGVGKTKLVKAISSAVNLPYEKISLGGTI